MIISFIGHSFVPSQDTVKLFVKEQIENSISGVGDVTFYLGGYGDFDGICACVCRELKSKKQNYIELVYVTPYITLSAQKKIKEMQSFGLYDSSIYPPIERTPPKFAISKRNEWMINNSDLIIAYVNREYGGAYKSLRYAKRKNKKIINICDYL